MKKTLCYVWHRPIQLVSMENQVRALYFPCHSLLGIILFICIRLYGVGNLVGTGHGALAGNTGVVSLDAHLTAAVSVPCGNPSCLSAAVVQSPHWFSFSPYPHSMNNNRPCLNYERLCPVTRQRRPPVRLKTVEIWWWTQSRLLCAPLVPNTHAHTHALTHPCLSRSAPCASLGLLDVTSSVWRKNWLKIHLLHPIVLLETFAQKREKCAVAGGEDWLQNASCCGGLVHPELYQFLPRRAVPTGETQTRKFTRQWHCGDSWKDVVPPHWQRLNIINIL